MGFKPLTKNVSYNLGVETLSIQVTDDDGLYDGCVLFRIIYEKVPWYRFLFGRRTARIEEYLQTVNCPEKPKD